MSHENYGFTSSTTSVAPLYDKKNSGNEISGKKTSINNLPRHLPNNFKIIDIENGKSVNKSPQNPKEIECDYDPYKNRDVAHPTTFLETLLHLLKGSLGTGILAMPKAFSHAGWLVGLIGTIAVGLLSTYCIRALIKSCYELCKRRKVPSLTYPATMQTALEEGPSCLRKFARFSPEICNVFLMIYQLGICCVYTLFIAENLQAALNPYLEPHFGALSTKYYMLAMLIPLILINWVKNLKVMAILSTIGNFVTLASFAVILYFIFKEPITFKGKSPVGDFNNFPLFLGTVLFSLEAIGVIMPLENEMKSPRSFIKPIGVLNIGMFVNITLYVGMGLFGFLRFGNDVHSTITTSLVPNNTLLEQSAIAKNLTEKFEKTGNVDVYLSQAVQILLALAMYFSHSLQAYVAIDISWNEYLLPKLRYISDSKQFVLEYIVRTVIVLITFALAISIPLLEYFISLVGAFCLSAVGISFPAIITICTFWKVKTKTGRIFLVCRNGAVILFGVLALVVGTYTSLLEIVTKLGSVQ